MKATSSFVVLNCQQTAQQTVLLWLASWLRRRQSKQGQQRCRTQHGQRSRRNRHLGRENSSSGPSWCAGTQTHLEVSVPIVNANANASATGKFTPPPATDTTDYLADLHGHYEKNGRGDLVAKCPVPSERPVRAGCMHHILWRFAEAFPKRTTPHHTTHHLGFTLAGDVAHVEGPDLGGRPEYLFR